MMFDNDEKLLIREALIYQRGRAQRMARAATNEISLNIWLRKLRLIDRTLRKL